jgi:very-short-patch-repair endonuclease
VHDLAALLGPNGTASTYALSSDATSRSVRRWLAAGRLVQLHPGWVTLPELADDWRTRAYAATGYTGGPLSHMSALVAHGLVDHEVTRLDVTVPVGDRVRPSRWLQIHRSRRPCGIVIARGLPATTVARALVDTWGAAHRSNSSRGFGGVARNAVLRATRERRVAIAEIDAELLAAPRLPGRAALRDLVERARAGAESHLEILGLRVLLQAGLPAPQLQHRIALPHGAVRVDAARPEVKLAVEFDGAAFHADRDAWQRDLRRDAALAALGWVVLRFSYADVTQRAATCGAQVAAVYRQRKDDVPHADIPGPRMSASGSSMRGTALRE